MSAIPPTASTRFQPPTPVGRWLVRSRMDALFEKTTYRKLTLIHAPAGFGKSTLAAQWVSALEQRGTRTAWLSLDDDDSQTLWFLKHLIECIQRIHPGLAEHALEMLEERTDDAERYIVPAIVNACQASNERSVIVLDDWHRVMEERAQNVLAALLESAGDKLGFIVTSRSAAGLPLASLHVHDQLVEVDPRVLRFDECECKEFLVEMKGLRLSAVELSELHSKTEGWVAALQLTSLSLRKNTDVSALLAELATRRHSIGGYLAENVLDLLEPRLRRFLVRISVLEQVNAELATLLTGEPDADELLDQALVGDLFLQRLDRSGVWFRFHHLFGDFLKYRLERDEPEAIPALHSLAARWFHDNGMLSQSVDHSLVAGEPKFAADVIEEQALTLVEQSRMATLLALVDKLPESETVGRTWMQLAVAWSYCLLHYPSEAHESLERASRASEHDQSLTAADHLRLSRESLVVRECIEMYLDRISDDDRLQREVLDEAERQHPWTVSVAANVLTFFDIHRGRAAKAAGVQRWAETYHRRVVGSFSEVYGELFAGLIAFHGLNVALARYHWENAFQVACERSGRQSHAARLSLGLLGKLHYHSGDFDASEQMLEEALSLGQRAGVVDFMYPVYESLAAIRSHRGDRDGAWSILEQGQQAGLSLSLTRLWAHTVAAQERLGFDVPPPEAPSQATARERAVLADELVRYDLAHAVNFGRCADADALESRAEALIGRMRANGNHFQAVRDQILLAAAMEACGLADDAEDALREAIPDCEVSGLDQLLLEAGAPIIRVMRRLLDEPERWQPRGRTLSWLESLLAQQGGSAQEAFERGEGPGLEAEHEAVGGETAKPVRTLNEREREILRLVDAGHSNREIAQRLFLGKNTVKWYLQRLYRAMGVSTREACVQKAQEFGLLS